MRERRLSVRPSFDATATATPSAAAATAAANEEVFLE